MTIDQFKKDLLLVAQNARDLASSLAAVGNTATVLEATVSVLSIVQVASKIDHATRTFSALFQLSDIISTVAKETPRQAVSHRNQSNF